jgi:hypothetical protein
MASAAVDPTALARIADAPWQGFQSRPVAGGDTLVGFGYLLAAWTGVSGELEPAAVTLGS